MKRFQPPDLLWLAALGAVTLFFVLPGTHQIFISLTQAYPFAMGFLKFALLATLGELLALRLAAGGWKAPLGMGYKMLAWGLFGVAITFMFSFFSGAVGAAVENRLLPAPVGWLGALLMAFYTSALMNLTFGIVFMAVHRVSDTYIDLRMQKQHPDALTLLKGIDWAGFVHFVVGKTIPFFWIPAHTLTFLLPGEYRVLAAAYLSIVLGVILVSARRRK